MSDRLFERADIRVPDHPRGVVAFAHGSGSGRLSPRNRHVAERLHAAGHATVLADLLTGDEERIDALRFDIDLLARRVLTLVELTAERFPDLGIGLFGASTGAAAALVAAAAKPDTVRAVVSRGGRPDLAGEHLPSVHQPTLLVVGGRDEIVIELNRTAMRRIPGKTRLVIVPGATHLFVEPGALDEVADVAADWFTRHLNGSIPHDSENR